MYSLGFRVPTRREIKEDTRLLHGLDLVFLGAKFNHGDEAHRARDGPVVAPQLNCLVGEVKRFRSLGAVDRSTFSNLEKHSSRVYGLGRLPQGRSSGTIKQGREYRAQGDCRRVE